MFNLEGAITNWRTRLNRQTGISQTDQVEMEANLREEIDAHIESGLQPREAFFKAARNFGNEVTVSQQLQQVHWENTYAQWVRNQPALLRNYFKVAFRNLFKHKVYSTINISGLAIGMTCCALILLYVQYELRYDNFHSKGSQIYRVLRETTNDDGTKTIGSGISGPFAPALLKDFPEVEEVVRVTSTVATYIESEGKLFNHHYEDILAAESHFLNIFDFEMILGDRESALQDPKSVVMSQKTAQQYFGKENPIGKTITLTDGRLPGDYTVTGVIHVPEQSSLQFKMLCSLYPTNDQQGWSDFYLTNWLRTNDYRPMGIFAVIHKNADAKTLEAKFPDFIAQYTTPEVQSRNTYHLQPLRRIHLYSEQNLSGITMVYGDIEHVYLFSAIAFLIMLIACVNFMNLATARSASRAKEIGMRKVSGAHRSQIIRQFLGEAILLSTLSFILAFILTELALPSFSDFVGKNLTPETNLYHLLALPVIIIFVGVISGIYPAFFLSAFEPIAALKGTSRAGNKGAHLRKGLVVFQFAISILLIISTTMVYRQLNFIQTKNLGFEKSHLINMKLFWTDMQTKRSGADHLKLAFRYNTVKDAFLAHPNVLKATAYHAPLGTLGGKQMNVRTEPNKTFQVMYQVADEDFPETLNIDLIDGRFFQKSEMGGNAISALINESAVKLFDWQNPVGKQLTIGDSTRVTVVGVIKDFHYQSLYKNIKPLIIWDFVGNYWELTVRIKNQDIPETLAFLEKTWKQFLPNRPFEFRFMDEELDQLYREDVKAGQLVGTFALLTIAVACLGLFGLAAFTSEQRTKEIGVRKVLGASVSSIMFLLSKEFAKLVLVANLIAWPIAYIMVSDWLQHFAYRTDLSWWIFALGGIIALLVALSSVGYQAWRAARTNPIDTLQCE